MSLRADSVDLAELDPVHLPELGGIVEQSRGLGGIEELLGHSSLAAPLGVIEGATARKPPLFCFLPVCFARGIGFVITMRSSKERSFKSGMSSVVPESNKGVSFDPAYSRTLRAIHFFAIFMLSLEASSVIATSFSPWAMDKNQQWFGWKRTPRRAVSM